MVRPPNTRATKHIDALAQRVFPTRLERDEVEEEIAVRFLKCLMSKIPLTWQGKDDIEVEILFFYIGKSLALS